MTIFQIIYLVLNLVGLIVGLAVFTVLDELPFISRFFSFVSNKLGNIPLALAIIFTVVFFIPALSIITAIITMTMLWGEYSR